MPKTSDSPRRLAYRIEEIERFSHFGSINIAFLRVECCGFEYFESCEEAHDEGPTNSVFQAPVGRPGPWSAQRECGSLRNSAPNILSKALIGSLGFMSSAIKKPVKAPMRAISPLILKPPIISPTTSPIMGTVAHAVMSKNA